MPDMQDSPEALGGNGGPLDDSAEFDLMDLLLAMMSHLRLLILAPLTVGLIALGYSGSLKPIYTAKAQIIVPQQQIGTPNLLSSFGATGGVANASGFLKNPGDQYVAYMKSESLLDAVIQRFDLQAHYRARSISATRSILKARVKALATKDNLIQISADDPDPQFAANLANGYLEEFQKLLSRLAVTEAQRRRLFFERQLKQAKEQLTQAEIDLKSAGISDKALKSNPVSALATVSSLKAQITAQEIKVGAMRDYYTANAPDFKLAMSELANLRNQLARQQADDARTEREGGSGGDYVARYRDFKYFENLYDIFSRQYELARVEEAREGIQVQILDMAKVPENKSRPRRSLIAITATLVCGLVIMFCIFISYCWRLKMKNPVFKEKNDRLKYLFLRSFGL